MSRQAKDLFYLLDERKEGMIRLDDLMIELRSGGLTQVTIALFVTM